MVNAEGKINFDEIFASLFVINVSILMYKKPPEIQYNTIGPCLAQIHRDGPALI